MKRLNRQEAAAGSEADPAHFAGAVRQQSVLSQPDAHAVRVLVVSFEDGARTHWHSHEGGQLIHVIEGEGRVQTRGEPPAELREGDVVIAEPGEEHWHGAAPGAGMRHLAVSVGQTRWLEPPDA